MEKNLHRSPRGALSRILCVEDNPLFQRRLQAALVPYGVRVTAAVRGFDALMQYAGQKGEFGAIIVRVDMAEMNGLDLIAALRERRYQGRIIIMFGHLTAREMKQYAPYEISGIFHQPFDVSLLTAMLLQGR